jgi:hypothetical protein
MLSGDDSVHSYGPSSSPLTILRHCWTSTFTPFSISDLDNHRQQCTNTYGHVQTSANIYEDLRTSPKFFGGLRMTSKTFAGPQNPSTTLADALPSSQISWTPSLVTYDTHEVLQRTSRHLCTCFEGEKKKKKCQGLG